MSRATRVEVPGTVIARGLLALATLDTVGGAIEDTQNTLALFFTPRFRTRYKQFSGHQLFPSD
ncbi:MAG: hypothetical protein DI585_05635 [Pseudomonas fluorescens]|nr:MAG: hypothetical protein DI585_05635 [Pseudomonas fluorescens]